MAHPFYAPISTLSQLLKHVSRTAFDAIVREFDAEKHVKEFTFWAHFISMLYAQLAGSASLRIIEIAFVVDPGRGQPSRLLPLAVEIQPRLRQRQQG
jgi:hypothetical protein